MLVLSLASHCQELLQSHRSRKLRPATDYISDAPFMERLQELKCLQPGSPLHVDAEAAKAAFRSSVFVVPGRADDLCDAVDALEAGDSHRCLVMLLPALEYCLRRSCVAALIALSLLPTDLSLLWQPADRVVPPHYPLAGSSWR